MQMAVLPQVFFREEEVRVGEGSRRGGRERRKKREGEREGGREGEREGGREAMASAEIGFEPRTL